MQRAYSHYKNFQLMGMTTALVAAMLACEISTVVNDDGSVDVVVTPLCLFGDFEGDATYNISSSVGDNEPFVVESTSPHTVSFGEDFKPVSYPLMLGLLSTAQPEDLTDMPEIDFFEESGSKMFSWVTRETIGESFRDVRTDAEFEVAEALFEKTSFRIRFTFSGTQLFFNDESDDPQNDADADSTANLSGDYVLEGDLADENTFNYSSSTQQTATDPDLGFTEDIEGTGSGVFQLVVRNEF
ncbi:MAG: hypothetical protein DHS20C16_25880 [Phycisphaerae bacterium]|nr:MAG: hypothetical protein DHS20C16_25880 [Phycisphaerae bacterium]